MTEFKYPKLSQCNPMVGDEAIAFGKHQLATVNEFWRWAYSNINDNASRGRFAEFLVWKALGCDSPTRTEWDSYDLLYRVDEETEIKVEVKSSAYIQTWAQNELSKISFDIKQTLAWDSVTSEYEAEPRRQADVYVFCIENCRNQEDGNPNPLDLTQWEFRVIATRKLNELGSQKTISLSKLDQLGAIKVESVFKLKDVVREACR